MLPYIFIFKMSSLNWFVVRWLDSSRSHHHMQMHWIDVLKYPLTAIYSLFLVGTSSTWHIGDWYFVYSTVCVIKDVFSLEFMLTVNSPFWILCRRSGWLVWRWPYVWAMNSGTLWWPTYTRMHVGDKDVDKHLLEVSKMQERVSGGFNLWHK